MTSFGSLNDNYYTPASDREWEGFCDYCEEEGLDAFTADFDAWLESKQDEADDAAIEAAESAREDRW